MLIQNLSVKLEDTANLIKSTKRSVSALLLVFPYVSTDIGIFVLQIQINIQRN